MKIHIISETIDDPRLSSSLVVISNELKALLEERIKTSNAYKLVGNIFVGVYFNYDVNNPNFIEIKPKLYMGHSADFAEYVDLISFYTTTTYAIKRHIDIPSVIDSVHIYFSCSKIDKKDIFSLIDSKEDKVNFIAISPKYTFSDVIINPDEYEAVQRAIIIIKERDLIFKQWGYDKIDPATKSILCFHGDPGTGKTRCAHAVAHALGKKLLIASYSQIESKFVGESEKNIRAYFKAAEDQDAVLFIDEADTFLSKRLPSSNSNSKIYNSTSNELFQLIEDFNGCIIFASNHIEDFDPAFISRIIEPVEFKIPDADAREKIIKIHFPANAPYIFDYQTEDIQKLVDISEGFSGRDIRKAMLISLCDKVYKSEYVDGISPVDIHISMDDLLIGFKATKIAKQRLEENGKKKGLTDILKQQEMSTKISQIACAAMWSSGEITSSGSVFFDNLQKEYPADISLDNKNCDSTTIDSICCKAASVDDKMQLFKIACQSIASNGIVNDNTTKFIMELSQYLGIRPLDATSITNYINQLHQVANMQLTLSKSMAFSEGDIVRILQKTYSEPMSYYKLSLLYEKGSNMFGGIEINIDKAQKALAKAKELGFNESALDFDI